MLDANTIAKLIRYTITKLKVANPQYENEPAQSILIAFEELAVSFDSVTERARSEALEQQRAQG